MCFFLLLLLFIFWRGGGVKGKYLKKTVAFSTETGISEVGEQMMGVVSSSSPREGRKDFKLLGSI